MTTVADCYRRRAEVLWRDTGAHVIALPLHESGDVLVLGGGSAELWRRLDRPSTLPELMDMFVAGAGGHPATADISTALDQLVSSGLVVGQGAE